MRTLTEIREAKNITKATIAKRIKKTTQYIFNIEKSGSVSIKKFAEISIALGYSELETIRFISENLGFNLNLR